MGAASGIALLYILVIIELVIIRFRLKEPLPWREVVLNLNSGHVLMWVGRGIEVIGYGFVLTHFSFGWIQQWPAALQWIFVFFCWDFCFYWLHRMHHFIPFLWNIHVVHHQGEHFSLSLGIRNSWYSSLTSLPFFIPLAILGAPLQIFIAVGSIHYFIQFYNHNRIVKRSGWLEYIMVTPAHHKVHHGRNPEYLDKNCSGAFIIWDKLFGTFQKELEHAPVQFGIDEPVHSENPFWINNIPFLRFFGIKEPEFKRSPAYFINDRMIGIGGLLLFGWLLYYISVEESSNHESLLFLFILIFTSTISICGLTEGKIWGLIAWIISFCIGSAFFIFIYSPPFLITFLFAANIIYTIAIIYSAKTNQVAVAAQNKKNL